MIVIVDAGIGNVGSIYNMLKKINSRSIVSGNISDIEKADKIILPGVGHFDYGMKSIEARGIAPILNKKVLKEKCPVLGICLGMQMMTRKSEEGDRPGLGWVAAETRRFNFTGANSKLKVPHMGWNRVFPANQSKLFNSMTENLRFYFVHSYYVIPDKFEDVAATTSYGIDFCAVVEHGNIMGTQFHPEKSHKFGINLLKKFTDL